ncbi:MAG TPA: glycosyltransferase [Patescibacteria group bacterium]|nr:glycosyltransferase [Patescibacteria group bacterium]
MSDIFLSVIIPSYDEMANLQKGVLDKVKSFLDKKKYSYEVLVVDDGSKDGSEEFVEKFAKGNKTFRLIKNPHLGKAGAVTTGMLAAKGKYVLFTDMDQATPIEELDKLMPFFDKGYDIVIGSRSGRKGAPWTRKLMAKGMIMLRTFLVGLQGITDTQCGFKIFTAESGKKLFQKMYDLHHGYAQVSGSAVSAGFDVEVLFLAQKEGYKIKEVPVEWLYVESRRVSPVKDSVDAVMYLLKIRLNQFEGIYTK